MTDERKPPFNQELYDYLVAVGTDAAVARSLAEQSEPEPEDETPIGTVEVTMLAPKPPGGGRP